MKDTLETNLPEEAGKLEETKKPVETPEIDATADVEANDTAEADAAIAAGKLTKEEILAKLTELVETSVETSRGEVEALKQAYYKIRRNEVEELKKEFIADGGEEKDFTAPADETENKIKDLLTSYKEKRAAILAEEERVKAANYALKLQLIDQLKELCESQDDFNKLYNSFKDIQQRWKEVKACLLYTSGSDLFYKITEHQHTDQRNGAGNKQGDYGSYHDQMCIRDRDSIC